MAEKLSIRIAAENAIKKGVNGVKRGLKSLQMTARKVASGLKSAFSRVKGVLVGVAAGAVTVGGAIREAFKFERINAQFKVLLGNMDAAKQRVAELTAFSAKTPFQLEDIANASRQLGTFSENVLGATDSLTLVGDAAAATGQEIQEVSFWVGRAYSAIANGQPFGEAAMRLQEMGILSGDARLAMEKLKKSGASNIEVWTVLEKRLKTFEGGMEALAETGEGLTSTLKDNWTLAVAEFGETFAGVAKEGLAEAIKWLKKLREEGQVQEWAESAKTAMAKLVENLKTLRQRLEPVVKLFKFLKGGVDFHADVAKRLKAGDNIFQAVSGAGFAGATKDIQAEGAPHDKELERQMRKRQRAREAEKAAKAQAAKEAQKQITVEQDMARRQVAIDKERAAKQAEAEAKAAAKKAAAMAKEKEKREKLIADLKDKEKAAVKEVQRERLQGLIEADQKALGDIDKRIGELKPQAGLLVGEFMAQRKGQADIKRQREAEEDRLRKIEQKRARGIKLKKADREFLEAAEAQQKIKDQLQVAKRDRQLAEIRLKKHQDELERLQKKAAATLGGIRADLAAVNAMK